MPLISSNVLARTFAAVSRHAGLVLACAVVIGLLSPALATLARPLLPLSIAGLLFIAVLRIEWRDLLARLRRPLLLAWLLAFLLLLCPVLAWSVLHVLGVPPTLVTAITLMAATPPLFSSPAMALLWGLDAPLSLAIVALGTLVGPFTLVLVTAYLPITLAIEPLDMLLRLVLLVGGCFTAGFVARALVGGARIDAAKAPMDVIVLLLLALFAVAVMDGVWLRYVEAPRLVWTMLLLSFAVSISLQVLGAFAHRTLGWPGALAIGYTTGNRAMGLLLAVLPGGVVSDVTLYFAVAQAPIYLLPMVQTPLCRWLVNGRSRPRVG